MRNSSYWSQKLAEYGPQHCPSYGLLIGPAFAIVVRNYECMQACTIPAASRQQPHHKSYTSKTIQELLLSRVVGNLKLCMIEHNQSLHTKKWFFKVAIG